MYDRCKTDIEIGFLETLNEYSYKLPNRYGINHKDISCDYGFFYENYKTFIMCIDADISKKELKERETTMTKLMNCGVMVIEIIFTKPLIDQIKKYEDVFGGGNR
jgi:hypothetical protein